MKRNGRTINKTARFTEEQVHKVIKEQIGPMLQRTTKTTIEICAMASKDLLIERGAYDPEMIVRFCELVDKYASDYEGRLFSLTDVTKYNRELPEHDQT